MSANDFQVEPKIQTTHLCSLSWCVWAISPERVRTFENREPICRTDSIARRNKKYRALGSGSGRIPSCKCSSAGSDARRSVRTDPRLGRSRRNSERLHPTPGVASAVNSAPLYPQSHRHARALCAWMIFLISAGRPRLIPNIRGPRWGSSTSGSGGRGPRDRRWKRLDMRSPEDIHRNRILPRIRRTRQPCLRQFCPRLKVASQARTLESRLESVASCRALSSKTDARFIPTCTQSGQNAGQKLSLVQARTGCGGFLQVIDDTCELKR